MKQCKIKCQTIQSHTCCWNCYRNKYCLLSCTKKDSNYAEPKSCGSFSHNNYLPEITILALIILFAWYIIDFWIIGFIEGGK